MARHLVAACKQRRREMESEADIAFEFLSELLAKSVVGIEPRHLIFVLVGHQLEQVLGHRFGEFTRRRRGLGFGGADFRNGREIAVGIGLVLIFTQEFCPVGDGFIERAGCRARAGPELGDAANPRDIVRGEPAPGEGLLVHLDRGAVDLDGPQDRFQRERNGALLEGKAEQEGIGRDAVAHQSRGDAGGVDDIEVLVPDGVAQRPLHRAHLEIDIGIHHEACGRLQVGVDDRERHAALHPAQRRGIG